MMYAAKRVLIFATSNEHKLYEVRNMFQNIIEIKSLKECGIDIQLPETHDTLEENAEEKLVAAINILQQDCFAEDAGLEIEALGGRPGVYSARYAGKGTTSWDNLLLVLKQMEGIKNRNARFRTVIALHFNKNLYKFEGIIKGIISAEPFGQGGFGYDPIFIPDGYHDTFAVLDQEIKNKISHRAIAFDKLLTFIGKELKR